MKVMGAIAVGAAVVAAVSACSGGSTTSWATPKEVLSAVRDAGFECTPDEANWLRQDPIRGTDRAKGQDLVCGGFAIALTPTENDPKFPCLPLTEEAKQEAIEAGNWAYPVAYGDGYVIVARNGEFPTTAQPLDFEKAFGATVTTLGELRTALCEGNELPASPSPSPTVAAPITQTLEPGTTQLSLPIGQTAILAVPTPITALEMEPLNAFEIERAPNPAGAGEVLTVTKVRPGKILINFDQVDDRYAVYSYEGSE